MTEIQIANSEELSAWMDKRRLLERDVVAIKGPPPEGATSFGIPITQPVNHAWQDKTTGEVCPVIYEAAETGP